MAKYKVEIESDDVEHLRDVLVLADISGNSRTNPDDLWRALDNLFPRIAHYCASDFMKNREREQRELATHINNWADTIAHDNL